MGWRAGRVKMSHRGTCEGWLTPCPCAPRCAWALQPVCPWGSSSTFCFSTPREVSLPHAFTRCSKPRHRMRKSRQVPLELAVKLILLVCLPETPEMVYLSSSAFVLMGFFESKPFLPWPGGCHAQDRLCSLLYFGGEGRDFQDLQDFAP